MHRNILTILLAGVIPLAFSLVPIAPGFGSASAQKNADPSTNAINLNTSRSNIYREETPGGTNPSTNKSKNLNTSRSNVDRMGGGGGKSTKKTATGQGSHAEGDDTKSNGDLKY